MALRKNLLSSQDLSADNIHQLRRVWLYLVVGIELPLDHDKAANESCNFNDRELVIINSTYYTYNVRG